MTLLTRRRSQCLLLAQSGHASYCNECPLLRDSGHGADLPMQIYCCTVAPAKMQVTDNPKEVIVVGG